MSKHVQKTKIFDKFQYFFRTINSIPRFLLKILIKMDFNRFLKIKGVASAFKCLSTDRYTVERTLYLSQ